MALDAIGAAQYTRAAYAASRQLTKRYSTSFAMATALFDASIRDDIYAIYGLLRIADELVDSYGEAAAAPQLAQLELETYAALASGFSANLQVHAFAHTARHYGIDQTLIKPFFASMAMDLRPVSFDKRRLRRYIHGSAEVVGLMCLRVFCLGDNDDYETLAPGAVALGAAFQKVNFLRDLAEDRRLGRRYLPQLKAGKKLDEAAKQAIIADIYQDLDQAAIYVERLPVRARAAVSLSYDCYRHLVARLAKTSPEVIEQRRVRLSAVVKWWLWLSSQLMD